MADADDQDLAAVDEAEEETEKKNKDEEDNEEVVDGAKTEVDGDIVEPATKGETTDPVAAADAEPATENAEGGCEHCAHKDSCCEEGEDNKPADPDTDEVE